MECSKKQELHHKPQLASLLEDLLSLLTIMEKLEEQRHWESFVSLFPIWFCWFVYSFVHENTCLGPSCPVPLHTACTSFAQSFQVATKKIQLFRNNKLNCRLEC